MDPDTLTLHSFRHYKETLFLTFDMLYFSPQKTACSLLSGQNKKRLEVTNQKSIATP